MRTNNTLAAVVGLSTFSLIGSLIGCASTPEPAPSLTSFSMPSASFETSYAVRPSAPGMIVVDADLVVRPDQACLPFTVKAKAADVGAALARARGVVDDVTAKANAAVRVDDVRTVIDDKGVVVVVVNAAVIADLGDGDAFARAAVVAGLDGALWPFAHPKEHDDTIAVDVGAVEPGVKDKEQHRQALLDGWAARIGALSKSVGGDDVDLTNCQAPPSVRIGGGTFEKVGLTLPISCTVAVKARA